MSALSRSFLNGTRALIWSMVAIGGIAAAADVDPVARRKAVDAFYMIEAKPWDRAYVKRAVERIQEAQASSPQDPWVLIAIAKAIMSDDVPAHFPEALKYTKEAVLRGPRESVAHAYHGWVLYNMGKHQEAWRSYQQAIRLDPKDPLPYLHLARAFADTRDVRQLEKWLLDGKSRKNTNQIDGRIFELERQLANLRKDGKAVEVSFLDQIAKQVDNPWVRSNYASFLMHQRRYAEAIPHFEDALRLMEYPAARDGLKKARALLANQQSAAR